MLVEFEPSVFATIRPVIGLAKFGAEMRLETVGNHLKNALREYIIVPYLPSVTTSASQGSVHSLLCKSVSVSESWIQKYLVVPTIVIAIVLVSTQEVRDQGLFKFLQQIQDDCTERHQKIAVLLHGSEGLSLERKEKLSKASQIPISNIFVIQSLQNDFQPLLLFLANNCDRFYREKIREYRKKMSAVDEDSTNLPIFVSLRYQFKMAFMELFVNESNSALKTFNSAYSTVISHYRKLGRPEDQNVFLNSVRWICDVIAFKIAWSLFSRGDKAEADDYMAGHISWFAASHPNQTELSKWKYKLYDGMSRLLSGAENMPKNDPRHYGYYQYLTAKNGITLETLQFPDPPMLELVEKVLNHLIQAYDYYREGGFNRFTLQIGRLIASQYLLLQNYEYTKQTLTKLRRAYRSEGWTSIIGDVLLELLTLAENTGDHKLAIECYWEYASLFPEKVLEEFDTHLSSLCSSINDLVVLDMSLMRPNFVSCAARFLSSSTAIDGYSKVLMLISNMTPLMLTISGVYIRFIDHNIPALRLTGSYDILPGTFIEIRESFWPQHYGSLIMDSVTLDLADLPLRLHFPLSTLSRNESIFGASWENITTNWKFLRALDRFTEDSHTALYNPLEAIVQLDVSKSLPLILGHPCPLKISISNPTNYSTISKLHFSGNIREIQASADDDQPSSSLSELVLTLECRPKEKVTKIVKITRTLLSPVSLRIDCYSQFDSLERQKSANVLTKETVHASVDIEMELVDPFVVVAEYVPIPTDSAVAVSSNHQTALIKYYAFITVSSELEGPIGLTGWKLSLQGQDDVVFNCLHPDDPANIISLSRGETYRFMFELTSVTNDDFYQPKLSFQCAIPDDPITLAFQHDLPALAMRSHSLFIIPVPKQNQKVGLAVPHSWRIWNMSDSLQDIMIKIESVEDYVYMGMKQIRHQVAPGSYFDISGFLVPLVAGYTKLPPLTVKAGHQGDSIFYETLSSPPIFVLP